MGTKDDEYDYLFKGKPLYLPRQFYSAIYKRMVVSTLKSHYCVVFKYYFVGVNLVLLFLTTWLSLSVRR